MNDQEKKQAGVLITITLIVLIGGFMWVKSVMAGAPAPTVAVAPNPAPDNTILPPAANNPSSGTSTAPSPNDANTMDGKPSTPANPTQSNPFRKVLGPDGTTSSSVSSIDAAEAQRRADQHRKDQLDKVQGTGPYAQQPGGGMLPAPTGSSPFVPSIAMNSAAILKGLVADDKGGFAVVFYAGTTLYLRVGDRVDGKVYVKSITPRGVRFASGKRTVFTQVGQSFGAIFIAPTPAPAKNP